jgi:hypothetical protein
LNETAALKALKGQAMLESGSLSDDVIVGPFRKGAMVRRPRVRVRGEKWVPASFGIVSDVMDQQWSRPSCEAGHQDHGWCERFAERGVVEWHTKHGSWINPSSSMPENNFAPISLISPKDVAPFPCNGMWPGLIPMKRKSHRRDTNWLPGVGDHIAGAQIAPEKHSREVGRR